MLLSPLGAALAGHTNAVLTADLAAGANGPVVVNVAAPGDGDAADCLTEGEPGKFVPGQTAADILANTEDYYVNVHIAGYLGGAIRGRLRGN